MPEPLEPLVKVLLDMTVRAVRAQQQQRRNASFVDGSAKMLQPAIARPHVAPGALFIDNFPTNKVVLATQLEIDPRNVKQDLPHRLRLTMGTLKYSKSTRRSTASVDLIYS